MIIGLGITGSFNGIVGSSVDDELLGQAETEDGEASKKGKTSK